MLMSYEDALPYAVAIAEGEEESPPIIDDERVENVVDYLSSRAFTMFMQSEDESDESDEETPDDRLLRFITNSIAAAYITGALDVTTQPNTTETLEVSGKSGHVTININVS